MKNQKQTLRKIVGYLNNPDEDGGFWLPNIQRPFVWGEEQICRLFDSILREYPISTLLVWKTTSSIRRRKFIDNWTSSLRLSSFYVPEDSKKKSLVLDGQQRLQSLYIGLCGSYEGKELHFDVLSGSSALPDDIKYRFEFKVSASANFPWIKFKDLVFTTWKKRDLMQNIESKAGRILIDNEKNRLEDNLDLIDRTFKMDEAVTFQELDSIDNPALYTEDDVVEVFIRANSGGTKLEKSDLLFSLLNASWDVADKQMEELLDDLNRHGFSFDRDFVLKTCLVLLDQGAQYEVSKFRKPGVREAIEAQWDKLSGSIRAVVDFVRSKTYIQCDKALPSYLALIPLIYIRHHFTNAWASAANVENFLVRTLLAGAFSGQSDRILDALVKRFKELGRFDAEEGFAIIRSQNRSLEITHDRFFEMGYGSRNIHLILNLWYPVFSHVPAYDNNLPQVDHIFPQSRLKAIKVTNPETGRPVMLYRDDARNQLANCMLLTRAENGAGGKGDTTPEEWFAGKSSDYLKLHLIPEDPVLWRMDRYDDFIAARKALIVDRFAWLLV
ncbi:TPA: DUF262 domain-containing protein [Burkholderia vietnamiensis]|uniref:GmrSD restriction endonuclease domain-containing protein n=1 Tax=Burkholderia vietnamiensis TaxID=60552 RepID=UPI001588EA65|nr:DUF262 domain-containing protein [Burkholderia vietnamiensis]HDR9036737.1 DUF262 domain-containing protein [Burkholderia vietnamiensis]HDR9178375.1 DUF262 domain-containing protein [Burkholderia vietnamiensis]